MLYSPDWLIVALVVPCLLFLWYRKPTQRKHFWRLCLAWWIKLGVSWIFLWVYSVYYPDQKTGDTHKFFDEAQTLYACSVPIENGYRHLLAGDRSAASPVRHCFENTSIWDYNEEISPVNEARTMIWINLLLFPLSQGAFLFHYFFFCGLAFIGLLLSYRAMLRSGSDLGWAWAICFAFPGLIFWTGGILKESVLIFGLGCMLYASARRPFKGLLFAAGLLIVVLSKWYVGLLAGLFTLLYFCREHFRKKPFIRAFILIGLPLLLILLFNNLHEQSIPERVASKRNAFLNLARGGDYWITTNGMDTLYIPLSTDPYQRIGDQVFLKKGTPFNTWVKQTDGPLQIAAEQEVALGTCLVRLQAAGSRYELKRMEPTWTGLISELPSALANGLLRPFPLEGHGKMSLISFVENVFFLTLICLALILRLRQKNLRAHVLFGVFFFLALVVMAGLITPVSGALVRYRIPGQWMVLILLFFGSEASGFEQIIKRMRNLLKQTASKNLQSTQEK